MYQQAVGFNPSSVLSGLTRNAGQYGKGLAMQAGAQMNFDREKKNQEFGVEQMKAESQQRQRAAQNASSQAVNATQENGRAQELAAQHGAFDIGMGFNYAALANRPRLQLQQALINGAARDF